MQAVQDSLSEELRPVHRGVSRVWYPQNSSPVSRASLWPGWGATVTTKQQRRAWKMLGRILIECGRRCEFPYPLGPETPEGDRRALLARHNSNGQPIDGGAWHPAGHAARRA